MQDFGNWERVTGRESLLGKHGYAYSTLSSAEKAIYADLCKCIENLEAIDVSDYPGATPDAVSRLLVMIDMDHPELFWMDGYKSKFASMSRIRESLEDSAFLDDVLASFKDGVDFNGDGKISFFEKRIAASRLMLDADPLAMWAIKNRLTLSPLWTKRKIERMRRGFSDYVSDCAATLPKDADEYRTVRHVFEYVARHTSYELESALKAQDVGSVFIKRTSVCKGYAEAFQYLLLSFGIPCFTAQGIFSMSDGAGAVHAWNYVCVDGVWNMVDVTMGDWNLEHRLSMLPGLSGPLREDFVDYRCMNIVGDVRYKPFACIEYPSQGWTTDYFLREHLAWRTSNLADMARAYIRLHNRDERFVLVKCLDSVEEVAEALGRLYVPIIGLCIDAGWDERALSARMEGNHEVTISREANEQACAIVKKEPFKYLIFPAIDNVFILTRPDEYTIADR